MKRRRLGNTPFEISRIGFGAWAIGGGPYAGWGTIDDDEAVRAIRQAVDHGVNWIDTAPLYGLGHSETVVGRAIRGLADPPFVFTKCSFVWSDDGQVSSSLDPRSVREEVEASLRRLGTEALDLCQVHWPEGIDHQLEDGWSTLADLKREGKIRAIGVSNFSVQQMERMTPIAPVETAQPPYSLLDRAAENEVLPYCERRGIGVIVYSPMASGVLTGAMTPERIAQLDDSDWRRTEPEFLKYFTADAWPSTKTLVSELEAVGASHGCGPGAAAVAWTLASTAVDAAIVGLRTRAQVDDLLPTLRVALSEAERRCLHLAAEAVTDIAA